MYRYKAVINIGERFGELVVLARFIRPREVSGSGGAWVTVRCDCGIEKNMRFRTLRNGKIKQCGRKSHRDDGIIARGEELLGRRFGLLTVMAATAERESNAQVMVKCDCGAERPARIDHLVRGHVNSCGGEAHKTVVPTRRWSWQGIASTYAITAGDLPMVKIGSARNIEERIRDLQVGCPVELRVIALRAEDIERRLHKDLDQHRVHGEWFHANEIVMAAIATSLSPANITCWDPSMRRGKKAGSQCRCKACGEMGHMAKTCRRALAKTA